MPEEALSVGPRDSYSLFFLGHTTSLAGFGEYSDQWGLTPLIRDLIVPGAGVEQVGIFCLSNACHLTTPPPSGTLTFQTREEETTRKFFFERDIPGVGSFEREQLRGAAQKFNEVLAELGPDIQWKESFVAADKTFCVYYAANEELIYRYAELSRFPATKVTEVRKMIDPTTAE